jgi:hypothetical protein
MKTLHQRIGARATLGPMGDEETVNYIQHQLQCAGVLADAIFTDDALMTIYEASGGIPRVVNQLCERALLLAYVAESHRIDAGFVEQATAELDLTVGSSGGRETEADLAQAASQELGAALPQHESPQSGLDPDCDAEPGVCLSYEPVPTPHDRLEVVSEELTALESVTFEVSNEVRSLDAVAMDPMDEIFASEEIVVDPYAMMDAARSAAGRSQQSVARSPVCLPPSPAPEAAAMPAVLPLEKPPCVSGVSDAPSAVMFGDCEIVESPSTIKFVESSDNPAVHEVGAGIAASIGEPNEPPILVIESRSQRIAGNLGRVDVPEQVGGAVPRAYRRLFTHARKP